MKSDVYRRLLNKYNIANVEDHVKALELRINHLKKKQNLIIKFILLIWFVFPKYKRKFKHSSTYIVCPLSNLKKAKEYIGKNERIDNNTVAYNFELYKNHNINILSAIKMKLFFCKLLCLSLFDRYANSAIIIISYCLINSFSNRGNIEKIYTFRRMSSPRYYLSALFFSELFKFSVTCIIGSGMLFFDKRYTFLQNCDLVVTADVQVEEINSYNENKMYRYSNLYNWGPLFDLKEHKNTPTLIDIGIYGSGEWARLDGWLRASNINKIKQMHYADNCRYRAYLEILKLVISLYGKEKKIKVYMHPFERRLLNDYEIYPPYYKYLKESGIEIDDNPGRSLERIYECKIGISIGSTIGIERLANGLDCYILNFNYCNANYNFKPEYLGRYAHYIYSNPHELQEKLNDIFSTEEMNH